MDPVDCRECASIEEKQTSQSQMSLQRPRRQALLMTTREQSMVRQKEMLMALRVQEPLLKTYPALHALQLLPEHVLQPAIVEAPQATAKQTGSQLDQVMSCC